MKGFRDFLPRGRHPVPVLHLRIDGRGGALAQQGGRSGGRVATSVGPEPETIRVDGAEEVDPLLAEADMPSLRLEQGGRT